MRLSSLIYMYCKYSFVFNNIHYLYPILTDKQEVGVHINTTFSVASSKKIKLLFLLNFLLIIICMVFSCSISVYYWNEIISTRKQLDVLRDQFLLRSQDKVQASPLVSVTEKNYPEYRQPKMESGSKVEISTNARRYFVENLGEDMLLMDSGKKNPSADKISSVDLSLLQRGEF